MKILHTEASCGWGGQEIRILDEAAGMMERGHQLMLLCPAESRIYQEAARWGVPVQALPIARKNMAGFRAMRRWIKDHRPDIINTHSSTDSWLVALACRTLGNPPPVVRTRHISAAISDNLATRWLYRHAAARVVTTGERLRESLIRDNGYPAAHVISIPTGIDTQRFRVPSDLERIQARRQIGLQPTDFVIGIVATLRSWKGHRYLIEALSKLVTDNDQFPVRLVIVGDGPQRDALERQARSLNLAKHVAFAGHRTDVENWLHAFDLFVLPSYANEGVPQALMQAMLTGLCCVTTDIGSISEIAREDHTAIIVPPQDSDALAHTINSLRDKHALREQLGRAARLWCESHCGREAMLDDMEQVFRSVLA